ncbi:hypothetical protein [Xanthomonas phage X1]|nr:hypothetical protein [Xanthomonas phage X1]
MTVEKERHQKIAALLDSASKQLEEARQLAGNDTYHWSGPTYGMGGWIESGEWQASSHSC